MRPARSSIPRKNVRDLRDLPVYSRRAVLFRVCGILCVLFHLHVFLFLPAREGGGGEGVRRRSGGHAGSRYRIPFHVARCVAFIAFSLSATISS